jgi:diadenosine tetraphosphate (Ap4A) HIT family hydrolase
MIAGRGIAADMGVTSELVWRNENICAFLEIKSKGRGHFVNEA